MAVELKMRTLEYLREVYKEEGPEVAFLSTEDLARDLGVSVALLYDHNSDGGVLWELHRDGEVDRYGDKNEWTWIAKGASIEWVF
jgi:hypothetical protein